MKQTLLTLALAVVVTGCINTVVIPGPDGGAGGGASQSNGGGSTGGSGGAGTGGGSGSTGGGFTSGGGTGIDPMFVYANSNNALYRFDATAVTMTKVGDFDCVGAVDPNATDGMRDLAIDSSDRIIGLATNSVLNLKPTLFQVDPQTGHCTKIVELAATIDTVAGISFVPAGVLHPTEEVLIGLTYDCEYVRVSLTTGVVTVLGTIAPRCFNKSGDVVSVAGDATYTALLVDRDAGTNDSLLVINPVTGAQTANRGDVGQQGIGGLAFFRNKLYAFGVAGDVLSIDRQTGVSTLVLQMPGVRFTGAAVATDTPVIN